MTGFTARFAEDVLSEIRQIFKNIRKEALTPVHNNWILRLEWTTKHKREYSYIDSKKSIDGSNE
jgi:hypothetical protein